MTVERARKRLDVVAATRRDPPELLLRIRQDTPGRGESAQNSIGVGVRIPLGTASRNQPLQAAALSELDVALTTKQRTEERLAADAAMAWAAVHTAEQQLEAERQRSALLRERATLIDRSFKAGETPLPELLRALAAATQADTSFARQQVALGLARARLQQSLGILP
ncbi:metal transporter [Acidovorax sp. GW101-3H11]|nr:metal transporter [Acidovorax sp. GW101-3H11]